MAEMPEPTKGELETDLRTLRRFLTHPQVLSKIGALRRLSQRICPEDRDEDSLSVALSRAIQMLEAPKDADSLTALYGLSNASAGKPLKERRRLAHAALDPSRSTQTIRTKYENRMIGALADCLLDLAKDAAPPNRRVLQPDLDLVVWLQLRIDVRDGNTSTDPAAGCLALVGPDHTFVQLASALYSDFAYPFVNATASDSDMPASIGRVANLVSSDGSVAFADGSPIFMAVFEPVGGLAEVFDDFTQVQVCHYFGSPESVFDIHYFKAYSDIALTPHLRCTTVAASTDELAAGEDAVTPSVIWRWPKP